MLSKLIIGLTRMKTSIRYAREKDREKREREGPKKVTKKVILQKKVTYIITRKSNNEIPFLFQDWLRLL